MIPKIVGIGLIVAFVGAMLSEMGCKTKKIFITISLVLMFLSLTAELSVIFGELIGFGENTELLGVAKSALKVVGLGYVFGISSEICSELGEKTVSGALELFGRIEMLVVTFPYIKEIIAMGTRLIQ